jgi:hypothetical protein
MRNKWLEKAYSRPFTTGIGLYVIALIGFWLAVLQPTWQADRTYGSALQMVSQETNEAKALHTEVEKYSLWYKPHYLVSDKILLEEADAKLKKASVLVDKAGASAKVKEKYLFSSEVILLLEKGERNVSSLHLRVKNDLNEYSVMTAEARKNLFVLRARASDTSRNYSAVFERYGSERGAYLSKYTLPMEAQLADARGLIGSADETIGKVPAFLPPEEDTTRSGDPRNAHSLLKIAERNIDLCGSFIVTVGNEITFQKEAFDNAASSTGGALLYLKEAEDHLSTIVLSRGLRSDKSLRLAYAKYGESVRLQKSAETTLRIKVEGKYDHASAYLDAKNAVDFSKAAIVEADLQVSLLDEATKEIHDLKATIGNLSSLSTEANSDLSVLNKYHKESVWREVRNNAGEISDKILEVNASLAKAEVFADLADQRFSEAVNVLRKGFDSAEQVRQLHDGLHSKRIALENARSSWPGARSDARSTIDDESGDVQRYGSYSSSARSDWNSAVSDLEHAVSAANDHDYVRAVDLARSAKSSADGTGRKAKRAYDDYQEEQERLRKEAQEAAAAAARASQDSTSSYGSGSSYDSGSGSSYGGGGSYGGGSSDSGGYSGGSSSSDGGGY